MFGGGSGNDSWGGYTPDPSGHQFDGVMNAIDNFMGSGGSSGPQNDRSFGGDPSQDGGSRYSG
jgi:hypothetical protein